MANPTTHDPALAPNLPALFASLTTDPASFCASPWSNRRRDGRYFVTPPSEFRIPTADDLHTMRTRLGLTRARVTHFLPFSTRTLWRWETDTATPPADHTRVLLAYYRSRWPDGRPRFNQSTGALEEIHGDLTYPSPNEFYLPSATQLRRIRETLGFNYRDASSRTGISHTHITDIERGDTTPSLTTLQTLLNGYSDAWHAQRRRRSHVDVSDVTHPDAYTLPTPTGLRTIRDHLNLTQTFAGDLADLPQETISRWELGQQDPTLGKLDDLLTAYRQAATERTATASTAPDTPAAADPDTYRLPSPRDFRRLREALNWSQQDVADRLSISRSTYEEKEDPANDITLATADRLLTLFRDVWPTDYAPGQPDATADPETTPDSDPTPPADSKPTDGTPDRPDEN